MRLVLNILTLSTLTFGFVILLGAVLHWSSTEHGIREAAARALISCAFFLLTACLILLSISA